MMIKIKGGSSGHKYHDGNYMYIRIVYHQLNVGIILSSERSDLYCGLIY